MRVQENFSNQVSLEYLVCIFNQLMTETYHTVIEGGADEPVYRARKNGALTHRIVFTKDYISSALHEISHWCVAGSKRREIDDYGYWYAPDGRSAKQQLEFEKVEVKPQAIEWILSKSCGVPFRVSADNLQLGAMPSQRFKQAIVKQVQYYCLNGLPKRARILAEAFYESYSATVDNVNFSNSVSALLRSASPAHSEILFESPFIVANYSLEQLDCFG